MKFSKLLCVTAACVLAISPKVSASDIFLANSAVSMPQSARMFAASVQIGGVFEFNAADLEKRLGFTSGSLSGVTFATVPDASMGIFYVDGVAVAPMDYLSRDELDRLCFAASEDMTSISVAIIPNTGEAVTASLHIFASEKAKSPPVIEATSFDTLKNSSIKGFINVTDPEEDSVRIQIIQPPVKGEVRFEGQSFVYEPFANMSGRDVFTICAVDSYGNYSEEEEITIVIDDSRDTFTYADMRGNPSLYAAIKLRENGVIAGRMMGGEWFFDPGTQVSRGEFVIMLLAAAGIEPVPTVNTGLPNDMSIPLWLKPYVKKAVENGIISSTQAFAYQEIPIRAEAVVMTDRAAQITDVKEFPLSMPDRDSIPLWALPSYTDLAAYKMLDLHDGMAHPSEALTNAYAADLIWQLYKHQHK